MNNIETSLNLPSADFDTLKQSLKDYLKSKDNLKDYDFDGSVLSILLDTLSYNSHLNTFYLNMIGNESFLLTAIKRANVVAAARDLGYTPKSAKSAATELYIEVTPVDNSNPDDYITLPTGYTFLSSSLSNTYSFSTLDDVKLDYDFSIGKYTSDKVKVFEGRLLVHEWDVVKDTVVGEPNTISDVTLSGAVIPNLSVDSTTLKVYVSSEDSSGEFISYQKYDNGVSNLNNNTKVFFISENELGLLSITFGDGVLGYKPPIGSKIKILYMISSGASANSIIQFSPSMSTTNGMITKVSPLYPSGGGSNIESIESIKYNAQLSYESQGKAVVTGDYEYIMKDIYPNAKKVISWGGQDNNPPQFGKVFIAIQVKEGLILTRYDKQNIAEQISKKNMTTITPIIVDPDYTYIDLNVALKWKNNIEITKASETVIVNKIKDYAKNTLNTFNKDLEYSRLLNIIDSSANDIISNKTDIILSKRIRIINNKPDNYMLTYGSSLKENSIYSSKFSYSSFTDCYIRNNGNRLEIVKEQIQNGKNSILIILSNAGSISYTDGIIYLKNLIISTDALYFDSINNTRYLKIYATPINNDISAAKNQILNIDNIKVI